MAWCLNQCWPILSEVLGHSPQFQRKNSKDLSLIWVCKWLIEHYSCISWNQRVSHRTGNKWLLNPLVPVRCDSILKSMIVKNIIQNSCLATRKIAQVSATESHWWELNNGLGNGLGPSGTKPLPQTLLIKLSDAVWHHQATIYQNVSKQCALTTTTKII